MLIQNENYATPLQERAVAILEKFHPATWNGVPTSRIKDLLIKILIDYVGYPQKMQLTDEQQGTVYDLHQAIIEIEEWIALCPDPRPVVAELQKVGLDDSKINAMFIFLTNRVSKHKDYEQYRKDLMHLWNITTGSKHVVG